MAMHHHSIKTADRLQRSSDLGAEGSFESSVANSASLLQRRALTRSEAHLSDEYHDWTGPRRRIQLVGPSSHSGRLGH